MPTVFEKLNLKDQSDIVVLNAPASFEPQLATLQGVHVHRDLKAVKAIRFAIIFATKQAEVDRLVKSIVGKLEGDAVLWFAYPKGTSRRYTCDFNRDTGWDKLRASGFDTVRAIAVDEDWSALRFRRVEFIKQKKEMPDVEQGTPEPGMDTSKSAPTTIDEYIAPFSPEVREILERIRREVRSVAPDAEETISYRMPAFKLNGMLLYFAAFKKHIGLYPPIHGDEKIEKAIAPYAGPKGNLQFPLDRPIPYDLIKRIAKLRVKQDREKAGSRKRT